LPRASVAENAWQENSHRNQRAIVTTRRFVEGVAHQSCTLVLFAGICGAGACAPDSRRDASPMPSLAEELNTIAQRQLDRRAAEIAAITDVPAAVRRQAEVRRRILELIGGFPDYHGPLNAAVTRTAARDGFSIENVLFESLPG